MTTTPIDHRARAEDWFAAASRDRKDYGAPDDTVTPALIGIGHMLAAIHDTLREMERNQQEAWTTDRSNG